MYLFFVKHDGSTRFFLFRSSEQMDIVDESTVICETKRGETKGVVAAMIMVPDKVALVIAAACGAYWPLAKVLRKYDKPVVTSIDEVPQWLIDKIRKQERAAILALIEPTERLPFDL